MESGGILQSRTITEEEKHGRQETFLSRDAFQRILEYKGFNSPEDVRDAYLGIVLKKQ